MKRYTRYHGDRAQQLEKLRADRWQIVTFKTCSVVVAFHELAGKFYAKAWRGKCDKPDWYHSFRDAKRMEAHVTDYVGRVTLYENRQKERKAEDATKRASLKAADFWAVGDVIYNSWGYDQTNVDWYQVVEVLPRSIRIREIAGNTSMGNATGGKTAPRRNDFTGEPMLKPVAADGGIAFKFGCGTKWDGRAHYCSNYA